MYDMFVAMTVRPAEGCIGRVLDPDGRALGTCFQVAPGILVTALHVVRSTPGPVVLVDGVEARVLRLDPETDLAVLARDRPLPASVPGLAPADATRSGAEVLVSAAGTEVFGIWPGGAGREARVPLGRRTSDALRPGMSGAPVTRTADGLVAG